MHPTSTKSRAPRNEAPRAAEGGGFQAPRTQGVAALSGSQGVVFVEYVALLLLVTITGAAAISTLGVPLMNLFRYQQFVLALPFP